MQAPEHAQGDSGPEPGGGDESGHFVGAMGLVEFLPTSHRCLVVAPLSDSVRSPHGGAALGALVTMFDNGASHPAMIAIRPDWTATQDLSIHQSGRISEGPLVVDSHLIRIGKRVVFAAADLYDAHGFEGEMANLLSAIDEHRAGRLPGWLTEAGTGLTSFVRIPGSAAPGMDDYNPATWIGEVRAHHVGAISTSSVREAMGLKLLDPDRGEVELVRTPGVSNSIGTIVGGAQAIMAEAGAEALCPAMVATDIEIHFLSQLRVGPARTQCRLLRSKPDHSVVSVKIVDVGNEDHLLALATITLQPA